jgi:AcrR family transcriptional regulator
MAAARSKAMSGKPRARSSAVSKVAAKTAPKVAANGERTHKPARVEEPAAVKRASIGARRNPQSEAAVLEAARQLLLDRGYSGFSVDEVARRAGAGKPTIYRWWPTKADLFIAVYGLEKAQMVPVPDLGSLERDLVQYTFELWRFWRTNSAGGAFRGLLAEAQASRAALDALRHKFLPERLESVRAIFARAVQRGELEGSEVEDRIALWVGFNWYRMLTDQVGDDAPTIGRMMAMLARRA